jgi:serine/threonine protein kinase/cytochrome c-type biogenesis protein CcmH/NrfG
MTPVQKIKGRYEIKGVLGEGGMGVVYRAYDPPPMARDVALKTLLEFPDRMSLQLFYKECEVLKSMSHPNIVEIFDIGEFDDAGTKKPFFVMPLLRGLPLDALIRDASHRLTVERVVDIISQTCRGLQAAHEHGLIHRDLKPSNLFVMQDDSVKIIDFGVAHTIDAHTRSSGFQKGTLLYMAPEQIQFKPVSAQSDLFSLGVVCYEALTRRQPFRGTSEEEIVNAILKSIPPPASEINPAVNQTVSRVIHKAMAKRAWNRFDSAREFGEALQKALRNEPLEIFDPSRIKPRIQRATKALEGGDYQFASEIVGELEAEGNIDLELTLLRTQIDQVVRQRTIAQLLESARARYEEEEDPLALQKIQEILQLDPNNAAALGLKSRIDDRRSERQIEKWLRLARQHVDNHAYGHARDALQNVMQLRPNEPRALRLLSDVESDEKEYLRLRQQKVQLYQSALNAWKNGEVSEALSQMGLVLELDRKAPDGSAADTGATYQNFYNKIRSEHDAINNIYAEARRNLTERNYAKALNICQEALAKYPNQALFQAMKFDIEEQQRQELSAFIAETDRKLEAEPDLDTKVNLLREALASYPGEAHFERSLRLISEKRDLVNSIVSRSRAHEERGQITEAISDLEILRSIYSPYPGLQFEIERLQKRREQQVRDSGKARWVEQIDRQLENGNYSRGLELLQTAQTEFPNDPELIELAKLAHEGHDRATQAEQLLAQGQELCGQGKIDEGLEMFRKARQLDARNPVVLSALRDMLVERARLSLDADWRVAEAFAAQALELDPNHALARSIRTQVQDRKREEDIVRCASQVRRLQAAGNLESAVAEVEKGLSVFPSESRLSVIRDSLNKEISQVQQRQTRIRDLEQARGLRREVASVADTDQLSSLYERSRGFVRKYPEDPELQTIAREIERVLKDRGGHGAGPKGKTAPKSKTPVRKEQGGVLSQLGLAGLAGQLRPLLSKRVLIVAGIVICVPVIALLARHFWPSHPTVTATATAVQVRVHTIPSGATLRISGEDRGTSDSPLDLPPGDYQLEAVLPGYETVKTPLSVHAGSPVSLELALHPLPEAVRIAAPDLGNGQVWMDDQPVGSLESGTLSLPDIAMGRHVLRIASRQQAEDATIEFQTAPKALPMISSSLSTHQLQIVLIGTAEGNADIRTSLVGVPVTVDAKPSGVTSADGLLISGLSAGVHELVLGRGNEARKMSFELSAAPSLDAIVYADHDVGSMLILAGEDEADVFLDGKQYPRKTQRGQLRIPNLKTTHYSVRLHKDGFKDAPEQTVAIVKGQEASVRFSLEAVPRTATLVLEHIPSGGQVTLDNSLLGTVGAEGNLTHTNIPPGQHALNFAIPGYVTKRIERQFVAGETIRLSGNDLDFKQAMGTLDVVASSTTQVTIEQGGKIVKQFNGSLKFSVREGTYTVLARVPDHASASSTVATVVLGAGEAKLVTIHPASGTGNAGMERWNQPWVLQDGWYVRRGGGFDLYNADGPASYVFTLRLRHSHNPFSAGSRIRWVVSYVDPNNYIEMQLDGKFFYRTEIVSGKKHDLPKIAFKVPDSSESLTVSLDVAPNTLVQRYSLKKDEWQILDSWDRAVAAPTLTGVKTRSFSEGKFGFLIPPDRDLEISNFSYYSKR